MSPQKLKRIQTVNASMPSVTSTLVGLDTSLHAGEVGEERRAWQVGGREKGVARSVPTQPAGETLDTPLPLKLPFPLSNRRTRVET